MSKYDKLWKSFLDRQETSIELGFKDIKKIAGIELDHSFLNYKKELLQYGYEVEKISLKKRQSYLKEWKASSKGHFSCTHFLE